MPKVSVITPLYNGKKYIEKAINSILNQTYKDLESIIVDDGSTDGSGELVKDKFGDKVRYVYQENKGAAAAVNKGISLSQGDYIAFCDHDDWWLLEKLEKQVKFLEKNKEIGLVYSDVLIGDSNGKTFYQTLLQSRKINYCKGSYKECIVNLFNKNFIPAPLSILIRKSVINEVGILNEKFSSIYDYEYWFRILEKGIRIDYINEPLAVYRIHKSQESKKIRKMKRMQISILLEFLKRNKNFVRQHPFLVTKKIVKSYLGFIIGITILGGVLQNGK